MKMLFLRRYSKRFRELVSALHVTIYLLDKEISMTKQMTEAQMVGLVRNALLVAGYEMGQTGDHWPVINDTIHSIARDWEESKIQREVDAEMKIHLYQYLDNMEAKLVKCTAEQRANLEPRFKKLRDLYDAYFTPVNAYIEQPIHLEEVPPHIKRMKNILATLGVNYEETV